MSRFGTTVLALLVPLICSVHAGEPASPDWKPQDLKLYYLEMRKITTESADEIAATMRKAADAGYKAAVLADSNFCKMLLKGDDHYSAWRKVAAVAKQMDMEVVPAFASLGYGTPFLNNDAHLAEGIRVENARFVVKEGRALPEPEPEADVPNGGFEKFTGHKFDGFRAWDEPGRCVFVDRDEKAAGAASARLVAHEGYKVARARWEIKVRPWHAYRIWFKAKTKDLEGGTILVEVDGKERNLCRQLPGVAKTQDWTRHGVVFNSWDNTEVKIDLGLWEWSTKSGTAWIDDVCVEPAGLLNVLRRPGCPVTVRDASGGAVFAEGKDYIRIEDPKFRPTETEHETPAIEVPKGSKIPGGATLQVSYYAPVINRTTQVAVCLSEPKVYEIVEGNLRKLKEVFAPKEYLCSLDEVRCSNHCEACRKRDLSSGHLLGQAAATIFETMKKVDPDAEMIVWNDLFDPYHNALRKPYYYVPGSYENSWEPLPPNVIIGNWKKNEPKSQRFFAGRGHRQILCGYYGTTENIAGWLKRDAGVPRVSGVMFCLYDNGSYDDLKPFADRVRNAFTR